MSRTTRVSQYQKGTTNLDFTEARDSEWQWHQLGHMQVCTSLQTDNHTSTPPLSFLQAGCPSCRPTNSIKALKASSYHTANLMFLSIHLLTGVFLLCNWHLYLLFVYVFFIHVCCVISIKYDDDNDDDSWHTHTHTHLFNGPFSGTAVWAGTRKVKPIWILLKQETVSGSGISWAICKSASRSRQITTPAPHHSVFLQARCPSCRPINSVKALKANDDSWQKIIYMIHCYFSCILTLHTLWLFFVSDSVL